MTTTPSAASAWSLSSAGNLEDFWHESASVHETAIVDTPCFLEDGVQVQPYARIMGHVRVGSQAHVGHHATIFSGVLIGRKAKVMDHSLLIPGVVLGDEAYCGPYTLFSSARRLRQNALASAALSTVSFAPTLIRAWATLAAHTVVKEGVTLGLACLVEPFTTVDVSVPDFAVVQGSPMRLVGWRCLCGDPLTFETRTPRHPEPETTCLSCAREYRQTGDWRVTLSPTKAS
jgi:UDP-2-acetamido-3-amino-2,3-dideoxy-glucuronate N-acetyltransferase